MSLKICFDAGHGGRFPGAVYSGVKEKDLNLDIALRLKKLIPSSFLTRSTDVHLDYDKNLDLSKRAQMANQLKAEFFISIHCNASLNTEARGIIIFHYSNSKKGKELALKIAKAFEGLHSVKIAEANFAILRLTKMPAVLIECGFMSNSRDLVLLKNESYRNRLASRLAAALLGQPRGQKYRLHLRTGTFNSRTEAEQAAKWFTEKVFKEKKWVIYTQIEEEE